ncbi:hypothetical protein BaRGS_00033616, partial [Batillaria attramentaria]
PELSMAVTSVTVSVERWMGVDPEVGSNRLPVHVIGEGLIAPRPGNLALAPDQSPSSPYRNRFGMSCT